MKITAVILHYYPERTRNIPIIVQDLKNNSRPPDEIIVFNNNPSVVYSLPTEGATVINSGKNYGGRARYLVSLLEPSDYYFFLDDDTTVGEGAVDNFLNYASEGCYGYWGKKVDPDSDSVYMSGKEYKGIKTKKVVSVDLLIGKGTFFVSFSAFKNMLETEGYLLNQGFELGREEDIILSMSNQSYVIPSAKGEYFKNLPEAGVGYCHAPGHFKLREKMVRELCKIRKSKNV